MQTVASVIGARPFGIAVVAGAAASLALGAPLAEAIRIGATASLAGGVGDLILTGMKYDTYFDAYNPSSGYIDLSDVVAGAVVMAGLEYVVGAPQQVILYHSLIAGLACGVGGKLAGYVAGMVNPAVSPPATGTTPTAV